MIEFWLHEYEDVLGEVFGHIDDDEGLPPGPAEKDDPAWHRLDEIMRAKGAVEDDVISDSESVATVGQLGEEARLDDPGLSLRIEGGVDRGVFARHQRRQSGDENTWEVSRMRDSCSSQTLRPV